jgi:F0F1-type ATP synthase membrane subunit b/b'
MISRDAYVEKMKSNIDKLNENMKELEAKAKEARDEAQVKYQEQMDNLHAQSKLAIAKLDEMKAAGSDTWEAMVAEMEKVRDAFVHSFSYFKSQL